LAQIAAAPCGSSPDRKSAVAVARAFYPLL